MGPSAKEELLRSPSQDPKLLKAHVHPRNRWRLGGFMRQENVDSVLKNIHIVESCWVPVDGIWNV